MAQIRGKFRDPKQDEPGWFAEKYRTTKSPIAKALYGVGGTVGEALDTLGKVDPGFGPEALPIVATAAAPTVQLARRLMNRSGRMLDLPVGENSRALARELIDKLSIDDWERLKSFMHESAAVTPTGEPMLFSHGTRAEDLGQFIKPQKIDWPTFNPDHMLFHASTDLDQADGFGPNRFDFVLGGKGNISPAIRREQEEMTKIARMLDEYNWKPTANLSDISESRVGSDAKTFESFFEKAKLDWDSPYLTAGPIQTETERNQLILDSFKQYMRDNYGQDVVGFNYYNTVPPERLRQGMTYFGDKDLLRYEPLLVPQRASTAFLHDAPLKLLGIQSEPHNAYLDLHSWGGKRRFDPGSSDIYR